MVEIWFAWALWSGVLSLLVAAGCYWQRQWQGATWLFAGLPLLSILPLLPWPGMPALLPQLGVDSHLAPVLAPTAQGVAWSSSATSTDWLQHGWQLVTGWPFLLTLYSCGLVWLLWRRARQYRLWQRLNALCLPYPQADGLQAMISQDQQLLGLWLAAGRPMLWLQPLQGSPFVAGLRRPILYLPAWFNALSCSQQQLLLRHELFHLVARHPLKLLLWQLLADLLWFAPWLRWWATGYQQACELTVDQQVLQQQPLTRSYAELLLKVSLQPAALPGFAVAAVGSAGWFRGEGAGYRALQQRLAALQPTQSLPLVTRWLLPVLLFGMVLPAAALQAGFQSAVPQVWLHPVPGAAVSSPFNAFSKPGSQVAQLRAHRAHGGIDLVARRGTAVQAVADGRVLVADDKSLKPSLGLTVVIAHGGGYQTLFAHLDRIDVKAGDWVSAGTVIGTLGNSGRTTGPHLHLELALASTKIDPASLLPINK